MPCRDIVLIRALQSVCSRAREDSLVDPITTQLDVFTTRDAPDHSFILPEISTFNSTCLECEVWQLANPGVPIKCQKCRPLNIAETQRAIDEALPANKDALPHLDIPGSIGAKGLKRPRSPSRCIACNVPILVDSKYCSNCFSGSGHPSSPSPSTGHRVKRSRAGRNSKLPMAALSRLQAWLDANKHNPYPTAETKRSLAQESGITEKQVNTWFTNARARQMSAHQVGSGSDFEAAEESDEAEHQQTEAGFFSYLQGNAQTEHSQRRTSTTSQSRVRPSRRGKKKDYRRNHTADTPQLPPQTPIILSPASATSPVDPSTPIDQETWQCTFCLKALVPKSWRRHEDTQHRPKTQAARWTCMLHGPRLTLPNRNNTGSVCAFCMAKNPSEDHFIQNHRIDECSRRDVSDRTFYRPDHLRQHIKNFHNATLYDIVQARWKKAAEAVVEGWTCGFCGDRLETWDKRETHISNHFKDGMTMAQWRDYPEMEKKLDKKKSKGKERESGTVLGGIRIGNPFRRPNISHQQAPPEHQAHQNHSTNSFQILPVSTQTHVHGYQTTPHCSPTAYQSAYVSVTAPMGLGISQAPILPDIPNVSPFMVTQQEFEAVDNFTDWASLPTTFAQQIQYPLPDANSYGAVMPNAAMQPNYSSALAVDLYGNPIDYQEPWVPLAVQTQPQPQRNTQRQPSSPYVPQHFQTRQ